MKQWGVKAKLLFSTVGIIVVFVTVSLLILAQLITSFAEEEIVRDLQDGRRAYVQFMTRRQRKLYEEAMSISQLPRLSVPIRSGDATETDLALAFQQIRQEYGNELLMLGDETGKVIDSSSAVFARGDSARKLEGVAAALRGEVGEHVWKMSDGLFLVGLVPIQSGTKVRGFVVAGERFDEHFAEEIRFLTGRDVLVLHKGRKIAEVSSRGRDRLASLSELSYIRARMRPEILGETVTALLGGEKSIAVGMPLGSARGEGIVILSRAMSELISVAERSWTWMLFAALAIAGVGILISLRIARRLSQPLHELMQASHALAGGDLKAKVHVESHDEVGRLARAFNVMARRIDRLVHDVRQKALEADQANRAKDKFLASVSHELRTPLTSVRAYSEILLTYGLGGGLPEEKEFLGIIKGESERLTKLIDNVLDLVRIEAGTMVWEVSTFDARELISDALQAMRHQFDFKQVSGEVVATEEPAEYSGDRAWLLQSVMQLLSNAYKFSPFGGTIVASLTMDGEAIEIGIADEGPGIAGEEEKKAVFDKFYQRGDSLTDKPDGTGLGLVITKEVVTAHGGSVRCEDSESGGARFIIRLPSPQNCPGRAVDETREATKVDGHCPVPV